jgi:hypothetical protein
MDANSSPLKRQRHNETDVLATATATSASTDACAWQCPRCHDQYDCQKVAPVRPSCPCKPLMCRKCARVGEPCFVCEEKVSGVKLDMGVLHVLAAAHVKKHGSGEVTFCADCARDGHVATAKYTCLEDKCQMKALCAGHSLIHKQWGHGVCVFVDVNVDAAGGLPPRSAMDMTHCTASDHHVGSSETVLTLCCTDCNKLLCRQCGDEHLALLHTVLPVAKVACEALEGFEDNLKQLEHGLVRCQYLCKQAHASMETLQQSRSSAIENLSTFRDRMRTAVERVIVECETEVNAAFEKKRKAVAACLTTYETSMAELRTMQAIVMAAKDKEACAVLRLHVKESVNTTLDLARELEGVQALHPKAEVTWKAQFSHVLKKFHSLLELEHPDAAGGGGGAAGGEGGAAGGEGGAAEGEGGAAGGGGGAAAGYVFAARRGLVCVSGFGVDIIDNF